MQKQILKLNYPTLLGCYFDPMGFVAYLLICCKPFVEHLWNSAFYQGDKIQFWNFVPFTNSHKSQTYKPTKISLHLIQTLFQLINLQLTRFDVGHLGRVQNTPLDVGVTSTRAEVINVEHSTKRRLDLHSSGDQTMLSARPSLERRSVKLDTKSSTRAMLDKGLEQIFWLQNSFGKFLIQATPRSHLFTNFI